MRVLRHFDLTMKRAYEGAARGQRDVSLEDALVALAEDVRRLKGRVRRLEKKVKVSGP